LVMVGTFLYLGYQSVPVAFALAAVAFVTTAFFTKISLPSIVGQMFNGINQLEFLAIPFFLLAGDMMTAANITERLIRMAQTFVGHFRSGLAHVVSLSSMLFAGISGSMIYSYFFGPPGIRKQRATLGQMARATRAALLPLMIPIIIIGGVVTGTFTPAEAGMIAVIYILVVLLPLMNRGHIKSLPHDF